MFVFLATSLSHISGLEWIFAKIQKPEIKILVFGSVKEPKESLCPSVRVKVLSRSLNHHLSLSGVSQVYLRSL